MKFVITGSLGNISRHLITELVQKGHRLTVISRDFRKKEEIEMLGAMAAIGHLEDTGFIRTQFEDADAVYTMIPPGDFFSQHLDLMEHYTGIARSFARAIKQSGVKRVVHLSSIGAHLESQTGLLLAQRRVEYILEEIPNVDITFLRSAAFYYNLKFFLNMIKNSGHIMSNYGGDDTVLWTAPKDVAQAAARALESAVAGTIIRYVVSEQISCNDTASILGKAIGKPELKWQVISSEQMFNILANIGMNLQFAKGLIEINCRVQDGSLYEDYFQHPSKLGEEKLAGFAREFAAAYCG